LIVLSVRQMFGNVRDPLCHETLPMNA